MDGLAVTCPRKESQARRDTLRLTKNVKPEVVPKTLGHSSIAIILDTYSRVLPTMQDGAARALGKALRCRVAVRELRTPRRKREEAETSPPRSRGFSGCTGGGTRTLTPRGEPDFESC